jgi:hypothetical protein
LLNNAYPLTVDLPQVVLPLVLIGLAFILKLVVDRTARLADLVSAVLELPVDVAFLATSLTAAFVIAKPSDAAKGLTMFASYIVGTVVTVFLWRRGQRQFEGEDFWWCVPIAAMNYVLCSAGLVSAVRLLSTVMR